MCSFACIPSYINPTLTSFLQLPFKTIKICVNFVCSLHIRGIIHRVLTYDDRQHLTWRLLIFPKCSFADMRMSTSMYEIFHWQEGAPQTPSSSTPAQALTRSTTSHFGISSRRIFDSAPHFCLLFLLAYVILFGSLLTCNVFCARLCYYTFTS